MSQATKARMLATEARSRTAGTTFAPETLGRMRARASLACEALTENEDSLTRDIVTRIAEKWTLWTMAELASADAPLRFSRLLERVEGVSQKSLTKVLRQLERDGLVTRVVFAQVPPRVEYEITDLAVEMLELVHPLWMWASTNVAKFQVAQAKYDLRYTADAGG